MAVNDLGDLENLAYLLKYDSVYGRFDKEVSAKDGKLIVDGKEYLFLQQKDVTQLPWGNIGVDIVVEATGVFDSYEKAAVHLNAGAKRVVITAPAKDEDGSASSPQAAHDGLTVLMGVNEGDLKKCSLSSNGSCTTNSVSPVMEIISEKLGIKKAFLNTVHGYTAAQSLVDSTVKGSDFRHGRAAAINIVPASTGAATTVAKAVHELLGKFDGVAMRVPVSTGSLSAIVFVSSRLTTVKEINQILKDAEKESRWNGIFKTTTDLLVSTDIIGDLYPAIADLSLTHVTDGDLCCVYSWYDNEYGYTTTLVQHVLKVAELM